MRRPARNTARSDETALGAKTARADEAIRSAKGPRG